MLTGCCSTVGAKLSNYSSHCQPTDDMVRQASEQASNTPYGVYTPGWRQKNDIYGNICATTPYSRPSHGWIPCFLQSLETG